MAVSIPFNKPYYTGNELSNMANAMKSGKIAGDGDYTKACEAFFEQKYGFKKALLTASCTDALELAAILISVQAGDEIIMPSYNFVSVANAFILRGANVIFADCTDKSPHICINQVEALITSATKAIVVVHYGGVAVDIEEFRSLADKHQIYLIEDAAQAINSFHNKKPLGSFGHLATFSFHETKNITCGEGGLLVVNDTILAKRAEIIREKGTNRASFIRKEIGQYRWVDVGSSFLLSDISAAFLLAQLNKIDKIHQRRKKLWELYYNGLENLAGEGLMKLPYIPKGTAHNHHIFYFICPSITVRNAYIDFMAFNGIQTQFHYVNLHDSPFYKNFYCGHPLPWSARYQDCLVRLPLFFDLKKKEVKKIISLTERFFLHEIKATQNRIGTAGNLAVA